MCAKLFLTILSCYAAYGNSFPVGNKIPNDERNYLGAPLKDDHSIQRRSFGSFELDNGFANLVGGSNIIPVDSYFLPAVPLHSYLPYPPGHPAPLPGPYPPIFGHTHYQFPAHVQYGGHASYGHRAHNGYSGKHKNRHNQYVGNDYYNKHGYDKGNDFDVCNQPGHNHLGPHDHHEQNQPVTSLPPRETIVPATVTQKVKQPTAATAASPATVKQPTPAPKPNTIETTTPGPIYDIDIRFQKS